MEKENTIFVFGSNEMGKHGLGAALWARKYYGARYGVGIGRTGNAYAIPTKGMEMESLPLVQIQSYVNCFLRYADEHPELSFMVTRIGCGLAGYKDEQIGPMFQTAPDNCQLPSVWKKYKLDNNKNG